MPVADVLRQRTRGIAGSLNSHRILLYSTLSTLALSAAIVNALKSHSNFYSVAIYLSKSSRSVLILANFGFLLALYSGYVVQQIFFGTLRAPEVERLYDRLWFFVTESLLAFTIFRDEFDVPFGLMFGFLLFVKCFHWLASDRIEWMDQRPYPGPPALFHVRMSVLFLILWMTDALMFLIAVEHTLNNGVGGMVLFASEYAILMASVTNTVCKYLLSAYDLRRAGRRGGADAPPWENKSMWVFYIELATDFLKLTTYLIFFTLIITFYGLPLNILRDVYITARSFITRLRALHRYQTATRNMDQRYPNATEDELRSMSDRTCIICREEMVLRSPIDTTPGEPPVATATPDGPNTTPKKLPCGHIFHFHCLRAWLERQQSCPTCRRTVLETDQQPQPPAVGARAPQPGAAPLPPNPFGNAGAPAPQNPPGNNPLGFLGRFFGAAAQPPIVPGHFAHGQFPQPPNGGVLGAAAAHLPQGIVIQYHIQYQPARPQPAPHTQQPLQPAPQFAGFHGPDGAWHPWGLDGRWFGQDPQNQAPGPDPNSTRDASANLTPTPTSATAASSPPPTAPTESQHSATTPDDATAPDLGDRQLTPREAAANAALRRTDTSTSSSSSLARSHTCRADPTPGKAPVQSGAPTTYASTSLARNDSNPSDARLRVPHMIPLPTHTNPIGSEVPSASTTSASQPRVPSQLSSLAESRAHTQAPRQLSNPPYHHQTSSDPRASATQLPPTLTDEQLAIMDRVTREAIDERLRVLEGVSGAVYRCIDDLMRMRSTLPHPRPPNNQTQTEQVAANILSEPSVGACHAESSSPDPSTSASNSTPEGTDGS